MSVGGVLGGSFNGLLALLIFREVIEHKIAMILACFLLPTIGTSPSLLTERLFGMKHSRLRGAIVDLTAGVLLGCVAYGLLWFNASHGGDAELHPQRHQAWVSMQEGSVVASNFINQKVAWVLEHALQRPDLNNFKLVRPSKLVAICLYGLPILVCFIFATRPLRFGVAVTGYVVAKLHF